MIVHAVFFCTYSAEPWRLASICKNAKSWVLHPERFEGTAVANTSKRYFALYQVYINLFTVYNGQFFSGFWLLTCKSLLPEVQKTWKSVRPGSNRSLRSRYQWLLMGRCRFPKQKLRCSTQHAWMVTPAIWVCRRYFIHRLYVVLIIVVIILDVIYFVLACKVCVIVSDDPSLWSDDRHLSTSKRFNLKLSINPVLQ